MTHLNNETKEIILNFLNTTFRIPFSESIDIERFSHPISRGYIRTSHFFIVLLNLESFSKVMTFWIFLAAVLVGVETYPQAESSPVVSAMDTCIQVAFSAEIVIKVIAEGSTPWKYISGPSCSWNILDIFIVVVCFVPLKSIHIGAGAKLLRLFRLMRVTKIIRKIPQLHIIFMGLVGSMKSISYVLSFLLLVYFVYGVVGVTIFGANDPFYMGNLHTAILSLFKCSTMEDWMDVMYINLWGCDKWPHHIYTPQHIQGKDRVFWCDAPKGHPIAAFYFVSFIIVAALVVMSLVVGGIAVAMAGSLQFMRDIEAETARQKRLEKGREKFMGMAELQEPLAKGFKKLFRLETGKDDSAADLGKKPASTQQMSFQRSQQASFKQPTIQRQPSLQQFDSKEESPFQKASEERQSIERPLSFQRPGFEKQLPMQKTTLEKQPSFVLQRPGIERQASFERAHVERQSSFQKKPGAERQSSFHLPKLEKQVSFQKRESNRKKCFQLPKLVRQANQMSLEDRKKQRLARMMAQAFAGQDLNDQEVLLKDHARCLMYYSRFCLCCHDLACSSIFRHFVTLVIILAAVEGGMQTEYNNFSRQDQQALDSMQTVIQCIFMFEFLLKIFSFEFEPWNYFKSGWNLFDFAVVVGSFFKGSGNMFVFVRLMRLLQILKLAVDLPMLQVILKAILTSLQTCGIIGGILLLFEYMCAIVGMVCFDLNDPLHYSCLHITMINLFKLSTREDWSEPLYINIYGCDQFGYEEWPWLCTHPQQQYALSIIYHVFYIVTAALILLTLFIGVVITSIEESYIHMKALQEVEERVLEIQGVYRLTTTSISLYREVFCALDLDGYGTVEKDELMIGLAAIQQALSEEEADMLFDEIDENRNGQLEFSEFLELMVLLSERRLQAEGHPSRLKRMSSSQNKFRNSILLRRASSSISSNLPESPDQRPTNMGSPSGLWRMSSSQDKSRNSIGSPASCRSTSSTVMGTLDQMPASVGYPSRLGRRSSSQDKSRNSILLRRASRSTSLNVLRSPHHIPALSKEVMQTSTMVRSPSKMIQHPGSRKSKRSSLLQALSTRDLKSRNDFAGSNTKVMGIAKSPYESNYDQRLKLKRSKTEGDARETLKVESFRPPTSLSDNAKKPPQLFRSRQRATIRFNMKDDAPSFLVNIPKPVPLGKIAEGIQEWEQEGGVHISEVNGAEKWKVTQRNSGMALRMSYCSSGGSYFSLDHEEEECKSEEAAFPNQRRRSNRQHLKQSCNTFSSAAKEGNSSAKRPLFEDSLPYKRNSLLKQNSCPLPHRDSYHKEFLESMPPAWSSIPPLENKLPSPSLTCLRKRSITHAHNNSEIMTSSYCIEGEKREHNSSAEIPGPFTHTDHSESRTSRHNSVSNNSTGNTIKNELGTKPSSRRNSRFHFWKL